MDEALYASRVRLKYHRSLRSDCRARPAVQADEAFFDFIPDSTFVEVPAARYIEDGVDMQTFA